ncbi:MAG: aldehyde dehydrogenase family protein [Nitriliruptoraceae bacterium]
MTRLDVRKTYKLFIGGAFPRSESGRTYVIARNGTFVANAARASRKDVRDAVRAARTAQPSWAAATAYNRGQVIYRVAEMLEARRDQFISEVAGAEGLDHRDASSNVDAAIDRWVWYAGWTDKIAQVAGNLNPVAGPYFNLSGPEPTGVVGALAPQQSSLLGFIDVVAPIIVTGNSVVAVASQDRPLAAVMLAEVLATSDVPPGVVNILTGHIDELAPVIASHQDVNAIDLTGCAGQDTTELEVAAAGNLKRVLPAPATEASHVALPDGPRRILAFCETKTVWHPKGW